MFIYELLKAYEFVEEAYNIQPTSSLSDSTVRLLCNSLLFRWRLKNGFFCGTHQSHAFLPPIYKKQQFEFTLICLGIHKSKVAHNEKQKKNIWVFLFQKYGKSCSISLDNFMRQKHLIFEECRLAA